MKAATGEEVSAEDLGGAEVHTRRSGVADHEALDDEHALALGRSIVAQPQPPAADAALGPRASRSRRPSTRRRDRYAVRRVSADPRRPVEVREIIARLVDGSRFHEFKPLYGETLVTGFAHLDGYPVGIIANDGILFSQSALKGAHFIELAASDGSRSCSSRTSPASWSAASTRPAGSPRTGRRW